MPDQDPWIGEPPEIFSSAEKTSVALIKGLPSSLETEKFILGSILLESDRFPDVAAILTIDDFALEKHRRIFKRMGEIFERGGRIDRGTLANELLRWNELESVDGLSYLVSLDDGLPQISNLKQYADIVAEKSRLRQIAILGQQVMNRALMAEEVSVDIISAAEESLLAFLNRRSERGLTSPLQIIEDTPGGINSFLDPSKREKGLSTGFSKLDDMTGGFRAGELIILAARPSMGKTALALNIGWHVATKLQIPVALFSLEMSRQSLLTRALCSAARVDSQRFRAGYLNENERHKLRKAAQQAVDTPLWIDDTPGTTLMDVRSKVPQMSRRLGKPVGLTIVDYLQLMGTRGKRSENRNQEVGTLSRGMKALSKELECPMLVLSQLSRSVETRTGDHRPEMRDLRDSGEIEQDADIVAFPWRQEVYKRDREDLRGVAELILAKQRNGPIGSIELVWLASMTKFESRSEDLPSEGVLPYADN